MGLLQFPFVTVTRLTCFTLIPQVGVGGPAPDQKLRDSCPCLFPFPSHSSISEIYRLSWTGPLSSFSPTPPFSDGETETQKEEGDFPGPNRGQMAELGSAPRVMVETGRDGVLVTTSSLHSRPWEVK